jgi:hypothetical protein
VKRRPLKRGKPLARKSRGPRQTPPKPTKVPDMPIAVRRAIYARAGERCEVGATAECRARGGWFDAVTGRSLHHRRPRRMGGTRAVDVHDPANLLAVCGVGSLGGCHAHIERNRLEALRNGWLLNSGADPGARACTIRDGAVVLLRAHGYVVLFHADGRAA